MFSTSCPKNFVNVTYNCGVLKCISGELRVEVDAVLHHHPVSTDSSSSSGYSSSSCSPRTPLCCDSTFDRTRDIHRRKFSHRTIESLQIIICLFSYFLILHQCVPTDVQNKEHELIFIWNEHKSPQFPCCLNIETCLFFLILHFIIKTFIHIKFNMPQVVFFDRSDILRCLWK